jgi:hypothetical protein
MYWSSADFSDRFRLTGKSRETFDIIISQNVFFISVLGALGRVGAAALEPPLGCAPCIIIVKWRLIQIWLEAAQNFAIHIAVKRKAAGDEAFTW